MSQSGTWCRIPKYRKWQCKVFCLACSRHNKESTVTTVSRFERERLGYEFREMEEGERQIKNILIHYSKYSGFYFHKVSILSDEYINGLSGSYKK